jgi:hypothetical protein
MRFAVEFDRRYKLHWIHRIVQEAPTQIQGWKPQLRPQLQQQQVEMTRRPAAAQH